jgi:hypothetical protein
MTSQCVSALQCVASASTHSNMRVRQCVSAYIRNALTHARTDRADQVFSTLPEIPENGGKTDQCVGAAPHPLARRRGRPAAARGTTIGDRNMSTDKRPQTASQRARDWLAGQLPPGGPARPSASIRAAAEAAEIPWRNVQRETDACGVLIENAPGPKGRQTMWRRPTPDDTPQPQPEPEPDLPATAEPQPPAEPQPAVTVRRGTLGARARRVMGEPFPRDWKGNQR